MNKFHYVMSKVGLNETATTALAKNMNLKYIGFGRYEAKDGKTYFVKNNTLIPYWTKDDGAEYDPKPGEKVTKATLPNAKAMARYRQWKDIFAKANDEQKYNLSKVNWNYIQAWFGGQFMNDRDDDGDSTERLEGHFQSMFPQKHDMVLYRVVTKPKDIKDDSVTRKSLSSWTTSKAHALDFFKAEYLDRGLTMSGTPLKFRNFELVTAKIPARYIVWSPSTLERVLDYVKWGKGQISPTSLQTIEAMGHQEQEVVVMMGPKASGVEIQSREPLSIEGAVTPNPDDVPDQWKGK